VLAGVAGLFGSAQPWFRATGDTAAPEGAITFSAAEATGGLTQALASVVLAGVLLTLVLAVRGRRVLAVLLAATGIGMVLVAALRLPPSAAAVRSRFRQVSLADSYLLDGTGWPWVYGVAGALVVAGAVLLWIGSPGWRRRTSRYEPAAAAGAAADPAASRATGTVNPTAVPDDPAGAWRALDAGLDPTDDGAEPPRPDHESTATSDPDVRAGDSADTMVAGQEPSVQRKIGDQ
jgi:uncharacterized membrane protein (TIGR02234 family)